MDKLRIFSKNLGLALFSLVLVLGIFVTGFYIGAKSESNDNSFSRVNAVSPADLNPFWKVWSILDEKHVPASSTAEITDKDRIYGAISGMVDSLDDPYTVFLPPKDNESFQENIRGNFQGVGMEIGIRDDRLVVIAPLKDSPAEKSGILAGDIIHRINGELTTDLKVEEAVDLIRGEAGTIVELALIREGEETALIIEVERGVIDIPTLEYEYLEDEDVFVISIFTFSGNVLEDFQEALREFIFSKSNKLILDLRGNPGGFLEASIEISSWFLPDGKVVVREDFGDNNKEEKVFRSKGYNVIDEKLEMVILVDRGSASASEIVAGALHEHGVATLVGEATFGKGSVQELININDETSVKVTIARWLTPNGKLISDGGLIPDVEVPFDPKLYKEGTDVQFEKALEILN